MSVLTTQNLAKFFAEVEIFSDISLEIPQLARIALVGPNGAGKTTLMHLLIGEESPSAGNVQTMKNLRIGFLPQRPELLGEHSLWDEAISAFDELRHREAALHRLAEEMADGDLKIIELYGIKQEQFEADGGYTYLQRTRSVLNGLGFEDDEFEKPLPMLSGGQKTRAVLARLLLESPDFLALDEPTNHLDINAIEWLEGYLKEFEGAVLAISHDRYFIDAFAKTVWELDYGMLESYRTNYSGYIRQRDERRERLQKEFEAQQAFITKEEDYIKRNIAGQNTRQAQGRRKRLNRLKRDNLINGPTRDRNAMRINMEINHRGNEFVITTDNLAIGYPDADEPLLYVDNLKLERGEVAALIGPNGIGKSTFMKTITGQLTPLEGNVEIGDKVELGYFAQAHETLNPNKSVLDEILDTKKMQPGEARGYLARYLFTEEDVFRTIGTLSGGERGRVALAKLALGTANVLLLDEPTNHLDIASQEVLENMIDDYPGTVLLVSHDRYLVDALSTQIWAASVEEKDTPGMVEVYKGSYSEFVSFREQRRLQEQAAEQAKKAEAKSSTNGKAQPAQKKHGLNPFKLKKRIAEVEAHIHELEARVEQITADITTATNNSDIQRVQELGIAYTQTEADLENALEEWEMLLE